MQKTKQKNLYDNFVKKRDQEERKEAGEKPVTIKVVKLFLLLIEDVWVDGDDYHDKMSWKRR